MIAGVSVLLLYIYVNLSLGPSIIHSYDQCIEPCLIFMNQSQISLKSDINSNNILKEFYTGIGDTSDIKAFDYHYEKELIFWADDTQIYSAGLQSYTNTRSLNLNIGTVTSIAIDSCLNNLYWVDGYYNHIGVSSIEGAYQSIALTVNGGEVLGSIVYAKKYLFTTWYQKSTGLYSIRRSKSASEVKTIYSKKDKIVGLIFDDSSDLLVVSMDKDKIAYISVYGDVEYELNDPLKDLYVANGIYYYLQNSIPRIYSRNDLISPNNNIVTLLDVAEINDKDTFKIFYQKYTKADNTCDSCNRYCNQLCLSSNSNVSESDNKYLCGCEIGYRIEAESCRKLSPTSTIVSIHRNKVKLSITNVYKVPVLSNTETELRVPNIIDGIESTLSMEMFVQGDDVFYVDTKNGHLCKLNMRTNNLTILDASFDVSNVKSMQYDEVSEVFYFIANNGTKIVAVNTKGESSTLVSAKNFKIHEIVISQALGYIFAIEKKGNLYQITTYYLDGENAFSYTYGTNEIDHLTVDTSTKTLMWYESLTKTINKFQFSTTKNLNDINKIVLLNNIGKIDMLQVNEQYLIWISSSVLYMADISKDNPQNDILLVKKFFKPISKSVLKRTESNDETNSNPCLTNNGGCSHFCLRNSGMKVSCKCPDKMINNDTYITNADKKTVIICEHKGAKTISCDPNRSIHITHANYGRLNSSICGTVTKNTNCRASTSLSVVKTKCENKQSCSLSATNSWFKDPCVSIVKYLEVHYQCLKDSDKDDLCPSPCLYYTDKRIIRRVPLTNDGNAVGDVHTVYQHGKNINFITVHSGKNLMFWSDDSKLYSSSTRGKEIRVIADKGLANVQGMVVDDFNNVIYWTDSGANTISFSSLNGEGYGVLLSQSQHISNPTSIVIEPFFTGGYLFWINDISPTPRIGRASLIGRNVRSFKLEALTQPKNLQIDTPHRKLYWTTNRGIETVTYQGGNKKIIVASPLKTGFTILSTEGLFYQSVTNTLKVTRYKSTGDSDNIILNGLKADSLLFMSNGLTETAVVTSRCDSMSCKYGTCLNGLCKCQAGFTLKENECSPENTPTMNFFILKGNKILNYQKYDNGLIVSQANDKDNDKIYISFDVDFPNKIIYFIDGYHKAIMRMTTKGSDVLYLTFRRYDSVLTDLKYDHVGKQLYWLEDGDIFRCEQNNGSMIRNLRRDNDIQQYYRTKLTIGRRERIIFSVARKDKKTVILQQHMSKIIGTEIYTASSNITSITVDEYANSIYFVEDEELKSCNFDGTSLRTVIGDNLNYASLRVINEEIYSYDRMKQLIYSANKLTGVEVTDKLAISSFPEEEVQFVIQSEYPENIKILIKTYKYTYATNAIQRCGSSSTCGYGTNPNIQEGCPTGYKKTKESQDTCAKCDDLVGDTLKCYCDDWVSCSHRWATNNTVCSKANPYLRLKAIECKKDILQKFCNPFRDESSKDLKVCETDNQCQSGKKCCSYGEEESYCYSTQNTFVSNCDFNNGECSHICNADEYLRPVCTCPLGMVLNSDNKTCTAIQGHCATFNPCWGSTCIDLPTSYYCICDPPSYGNHCEKGFCLSNTCLNGGSCNEHDGGFTCACRNQYYGEICEKQDPCFKHDCINNSTCLNLTNTAFKCQCDISHYGDKCQYVDHCASSPCKNGGACSLDVRGNMMCQCAQGFIGATCEQRHKCFTIGICLNGGVCAIQGDDYDCQCEIYYTGRNCEIYFGDNVASVKLQAREGEQITKASFQNTMAIAYTEFCSKNDCLNGDITITRKRRATSVVIQPTHIIVVQGYPKEVGNGETQVLYTVVIPLAPGSSSTSLINQQKLVAGVEQSSAIINQNLRANVVSVNKYQQPTSSDSSSNNLIIGVAAGGSILILIVLIITVGFCIVKRRKSPSQDIQITMQQSDGSCATYHGKLGPKENKEPDVRYIQTSQFSKQPLPSLGRATLGAAPPPPDYNKSLIPTEDEMYEGIDAYEATKPDDMYLQSEDVKFAVSNNNQFENNYQGLDIKNSVIENNYAGLESADNSYITPNTVYRVNHSVPDDILAKERERSRIASGMSVEPSEDYTLFNIPKEEESYMALQK